MRNIVIKKVEGRKDLKKFIEFPENLYKDQPNWIPALHFDERALLNPKKNKAMAYCDACLWLAYKDNKIAGRIAGIINHNANRDWNKKNARFGWIDFIDDIDVAKALLDTVEQWGKEHGMTNICGPLGFTDMDREGMLVEGFENQATLTTIYNYPYYPEYLEKLGYTKDVDWLQESFELPDELPESITKYQKLIEEHSGAHVAPCKTRKQLKRYAYGMFNVINKAFPALYEFTPMNKEQIDNYVKDYVPIINKKYLAAAVNDQDQVLGFALAFPSINKGLLKSKGKLFPTGIFHILHSMRHFDILELWMIGIMPEYQNTGISALIFQYIHQQCLKYGVRKAITNPKLEENKKVQRLFDYYEIKPYMRRRSYKKEL